MLFMHHQFHSAVSLELMSVDLGGTFRTLTESEINLNAVPPTNGRYERYTSVTRGNLSPTQRNDDRWSFNLFMISHSLSTGHVDDV